MTQEMQFNITDENSKVLTLKNKSFLVCANCGNTEAESWYFCELKRKLYCKECMWHEFPCRSDDHMDYRIDRVEIVNVKKVRK